MFISKQRRGFEGIYNAALHYSVLSGPYAIVTAEEKLPNLMVLFTIARIFHSKTKNQDF